VNYTSEILPDGVVFMDRNGEEENIWPAGRM